ncbi:cilia- and flagella-associated protein 184 [Nerophis lumbriciformis]|uniref:cilia- and flagella-associated protein 184 n=1 Tax=Nerophis lumbriciformis TaxID=546530 RepID=UPI002ADF6826|nr:coiled-coil domain-containing protein 96 [Nerophis lumbriciformis]
MDEGLADKHEDQNGESQDKWTEVVDPDGEDPGQQDTREPSDIVVVGTHDKNNEEPPSPNEESRETFSTSMMEDTSKHNMDLVQELLEEEDKVSQHNMLLQAKLAFYFSKKTPEQEDPQVCTQDYDRCVNLLEDWRRQHAAQLVSAQQQEVELRLHCQREQDKVEDEWRALLALKKKLAVPLVSRRLGQEAAQARVEATLESERLVREELRSLRVKHGSLKSAVRRLEAELRDEEEEQAGDHLQLRFEQLLADKMQQRKVFEQRSQEAFKLHKKMKRTLELLSSAKEKLHRSRTEVLSKREQLAQLDATMAAKRDLLARTKRACSRLQRHNMDLEHDAGLLGHRMLLRDFGITACASKLLQDKVDRLKSRLEEMLSTKTSIA